MGRSHRMVGFASPQSVRTVAAVTTKSWRGPPYCGQSVGLAGDCAQIVMRRVIIVDIRVVPKWRVSEGGGECANGRPIGHTVPPGPGGLIAILPWGRGNGSCRAVGGCEML